MSHAEEASDFRGSSSETAGAENLKEFEAERTGTGTESIEVPVCSHEQTEPLNSSKGNANVEQEYEEDMLSEVRLSWVDDPVPSRFSSHRALTRYARELKLIRNTLKEYSFASTKVAQNQLDATLEYGLKAHTIYLDALHRWLEQNPTAFSREAVQKLVKEYRVQDTEDLKRYHARASKEVDARSVCTTISRSSCGTNDTNLSQISEASQLIIHGQKRQIEQLQHEKLMKELEHEEEHAEQQLAIRRMDIQLRRQQVELERRKELPVADELETVTDATSMMQLPDTRGPNASVAKEFIVKHKESKTPHATPATVQEQCSSRSHGIAYLSTSANDQKTGSNRQPQKLRTTAPPYKPMGLSACSNLQPSGTYDARPLSNTYIPGVGQADVCQSRLMQPLPDANFQFMPQPFWIPQRSLLEEVGMHFSGRDLAEYPAYRHRFMLRQNELRNSRPDLFLRWIESTVDGEAKRYIRNAFAILDPGKACDTIWETLEEVYGRKDVIVEHAKRQVKRARMSIGHDRKALLELRADLKNLEGIAMSVSQTQVLENPQLLGQIYTSFDEKLRAKFDAQNSRKKWTFIGFIIFLTEEISYVDSLHLMRVDVNETKVGGHMSSRYRPSLPRVATVAKDPNKHPYIREHAKAKVCYLHPDASSHTLATCRSFHALSVSERWRIAKDNRLCFTCLDQSHVTKQCQSGMACAECKGGHHTLLHYDQQQSSKPQSDKAEGAKRTSTNNSKGTDDSKASTGSRKKHNEVVGFLYDEVPCGEKVGIMQMAAIVQDRKGYEAGRIDFYAVIDTGATQTIGSRELAEKLYGRWSPNEERTFKLFDGTTMNCDAMKNCVNLAGRDGGNIDLGLITFIDKELPFSDYLPSLGNLSQRVDMILGSDLAWKHILLGSKLAWNSETGRATHKLGTFWFGTSSSTSEDKECDDVVGVAELMPQHTTSKVRLAPEDRKIDLKKLIEEPLYCSKNDDKLCTSKKDDEILEWYRSSVKEVQLSNDETHLEFSLPWAIDPGSGLLQNNYQQAKSALRSLQKRMATQPELRKMYCEKIDKAISEGHLVRVSDDDSSSDSAENHKPVFYIPHFNTSQAKFRVVYDAAREYRGVSLNGMLERGPIFMQSLKSILMRFCERYHGIAGDIANMFFQIRIAPKDRNMLRILWFDGLDMQGEITAFQFQVAPYGLRCIPSMAGYAMIYTAERNVPGVSEDATNRVKRDMFVDDFISGVDSIEEGQQVIEEVTKLLKSTGFTLTKWNASNRRILANVPENHLAPALRDIREKDCHESISKKQTALGLVWDTDSDKLSLKKPTFDVSAQESFTKRQVVSQAHQIFDPLFWWAPLYVHVNLCCSKIVRSVEDWDGKVPSDLAKEWKRALIELNSIDTLAIPRRRVPMVSPDRARYEFHAFGDSSKDVAAAAVYLRVCSGNKWFVALMAAKTTIFSQSEMTRGSIPRKELIALDLTARLLKECLESTTLRIDDYEIWSDSQTVIKWCSSNSLELRVFERNRVDLILRNTRGKLPKYVQTDVNPADVATRGCRASQKERWELWISGPKFLRHPPVTCGGNAEETGENQGASTVAGLMLTVPEKKVETTAFAAHALERTNKLWKAVEVVSNVIRYFNHWKIRALSKKPVDEQPENLPASRTALLVLVRAAQHECLGEVINVMHTGKTYEDAIMTIPTVRRKTWMHSLVKFVPFLDEEGVLRVGGRFDYKDDLRDEQKHPAFLPKQHRVTEIIVLDRHEKLAHRAAEAVHASLCNDFGLRLIGGTVTARAILSSCFTCKTLRKSRAMQLMSPLPPYRITSRKPVFSSVSLDYAGPYEVKRGRSIEKRWLCLFVCNATSAVRIEVVESLETTAFLNALRRFLCLTGDKTRHIRSDCATTFVGARNVLEKDRQTTLPLTASTEFRRFAKERQIEWEFSTPASSHHQGLVERHIRTFKETTDAALGPQYRKRTPTDFELLTVFREAELVVNCRPLGHFSGDEDDCQPIRPLDLMTGYMTPTNQGTSSYVPNIGDELRKGHRYTQKLANKWWDRWMSSYFTSLQKTQKWTRTHQNLAPGDFVLLANDETIPRGKYPFALVTDINKCPDGLVRSATVRTSEGLIRERDIRKLILLEKVRDESLDEAQHNNQATLEVTTHSDDELDFDGYDNASKDEMSQQLQ